MRRSSTRPANSPSFSSSLLDKVFRSPDSTLGTSTTTRSTSSDRHTAHQSTSEKKTKKIGPNRRKLDADNNKPERNRSNDFRSNPSRDGPVSTSHDHADRKPNPNDVIGVMNLKPIRTSAVRSDYHHPDRDSSRKMSREGCRNSSKPKHETASASPSISFQNAKIRAQKMYGQLKDVKQPISPGGRLTRFITSLFTKRNSSNKGEKVRETEAVRTRHVPVTTCSSAASYCRSCLSSKPTGGSKNSVRFCPVNIVIDDEPRDNPRVVASRQKCESDGIEERRIKESNLKDLSKNCKYNRDGVLSTYDGKLSDDEDRHDGDNEDDVGSCGSSDLFELDHIGGTVNHSINDELPVYETTEFHSKNPAIWFVKS